MHPKLLCFPAVSFALYAENSLDLLSNFTEVVFQVGAVDCESHAKFCKEQEVQQFPKLLMYPFKAEGKSKPVTHVGDWTNKALSNFYNRQFSPSVTSLTHQNYVEAMSKNQERPWVILVRKTNVLPVSWLAVCGEFEKRIDCYDIRVSTLAFILSLPSWKHAIIDVLFSILLLLKAISPMTYQRWIGICAGR